MLRPLYQIVRHRALDLAGELVGEHHSGLGRQMALLWHHAVCSLAQDQILVACAEAEVARLAAHFEFALLRMVVGWSRWSVYARMSTRHCMGAGVNALFFFNLLAVNADTCTNFLLVLRLRIERVAKR